MHIYPREADRRGNVLVVIENQNHKMLLSAKKSRLFSPKNFLREPLYREKTCGIMLKTKKQAGYCPLFGRMSTKKGWTVFFWERQ